MITAGKICKYVSKYLRNSVMGNPKETKFVFRDGKTGVDGFVVIEDKTFVVVMKASNEDKDWISNFSFIDLLAILKGFKKYYPYGDPKDIKVRIHQAYARGYLAVREKLHDFYRKSLCTEVVVLGYSMGGGLAPIVALDLQYTFNLNADEIGCGFSGPRVFNNAGKISYNKRVPRTIQFKSGNDIVTKLPPPLFNFFHVGEKKIHVGVSEHWWKFSFLDHAKYEDIIQIADFLKVD